MRYEEVIGLEFIGRDYELALFQKIIEKETSEKLLVLYGIGGVGKSWLIRKLTSEFSKKWQTVTAHIDFSQGLYVDYLGILLALRNQLGSEPFVTFTASVNDYSQQMRTIYLPDTRSSISVNIANSVFEGNVGDIVGVKLENVQIMLPREELQRLRKEAQDKITQAFLVDLGSLSNEKLVVLLFDTYELVEDQEIGLSTDIGVWFRRSFIPGIRDICPSVNIVIAGRRTLTWSLEDREWLSWIKQHEVKSFSISDASVYCQRRLSTPKSLLLIDSIYKFTKGHPQCLSLACDLINEVERQGGEVNEEDFQAQRRLLDEKLISEFLMNSILSRLSKEVYDAILCCAVPHYFDAETIRTIISNGDLGHSLLDQIKRYSFVYPSTEAGWRYHEVIRMLLIAKWKRDDPSGLVAIHRKALSLVERRLAAPGHPLKRELMLERLYHLGNVDEEAALLLFHELCVDSDKSADLTFIERLIAIFREIHEDSPLQVATQNWLAYHKARLQYLKGEWAAAEHEYLRLQDSCVDTVLWACLAADLGSLYQGLGRLDDAVYWLTKSLEKREQVGDVAGIIASLNELGSAYRTKINLKEALNYYDRSRQLAVQHGEDRFITEVAYSSLYSGVIHSGLGNYSEALASYDKALMLFKRQGNQYGLALVNKRLGWLARLQGRFNESIIYHQEALKMMKELHLPFPMAELHHSLGTVYRLQAKWDLAIDSFQQALKTFRDLDAKRHSGHVYTEIGALLKDRGSLENKHEYLLSAIEHLEQSINIKRLLNQMREASAPLFYLGDVYILLKQWDKAGEYLLESLEVSREINVRINETRSLTGLCNLFYKTGNYSEMRVYGDQALSIAMADGYNHYTAEVYYIYGNVRLEGDDISGAVRDYLYALFYALRYNREYYLDIQSRIISHYCQIDVFAKRPEIFFEAILAAGQVDSLDVEMQQIALELRNMFNAHYGNK
ncbi:MAG: tetratricopeptide repeat protein [Burkholderiaceae bacterium]|nr:tetratricopeptide repeat protein [Burkholderiaceae bacterium]